MYKLLSLSASFFWASLVIVAISFVSCDDDDDPSPDLSDDVYELAVRRINPGVSIEEFTTARDAFVARLMQQEGTSNDREFQPFFDFGAGIPMDSFYIGMTQYADLATFTAIGNEAQTWPEAGAFFGLFSLVSFEALEPIEGYGPVDLSTIAPLSSSEVLEIAVRDLSLYADFDASDYETKRDAFLELLSQQSGVLREVQWQSRTNSNIVVGMTIYENAAAPNSILSDPTFVNSPIVSEFLGSYPANVFGSINTVLK